MLDIKNVCVFAGELFKEMTVDYERATSEERLDEVCLTVRVRLQSTTSRSIFLKNHPQKRGPRKLLLNWIYL